MKVPLDQNSVPLDQNSVSLDQNSVPLDQNSVPLDQNSVPLDINFLRRCYYRIVYLKLESCDLMGGVLAVLRSDGWG